MVIRRFNVYLVRLDPTVGSEIRKTRPCVVVSPNEINRYSNTLIVAPMTTKEHTQLGLAVGFRESKDLWWWTNFALSIVRDLPKGLEDSTAKPPRVYWTYCKSCSRPDAHNLAMGLVLATSIPPDRPANFVQKGAHRFYTPLLIRPMCAVVDSLEFLPREQLVQRLRQSPQW
jgi:hypothetical protein